MKSSENYQFEANSEYSDRNISENQLESSIHSESNNKSSEMGDSSKIDGQCSDFGAIDDATFYDDSSIFPVIVMVNNTHGSNALTESGVDLHDLDQSGQTVKTDMKSLSEFNESADLAMQDNIQSAVDANESESSFNFNAMPKNASSPNQSSTNESYMSKLEVSQSDLSLDVHVSDIFSDTLDEMPELPIEARSITSSVEKIAMEMITIAQDESDADVDASPLEIGDDISPNAKDTMMVADMHTSTALFEVNENVAEQTANKIDVAPRDKETITVTAIEMVPLETTMAIEQGIPEQKSPDKLTERPSETPIKSKEIPHESGENLEDVMAVPLLQNKFLEVTKVQEIRSSPRRSPRPTARLISESTPKKAATPAMTSLDSPYSLTPRRSARAAKSAASINIAALCVKDTPSKSTKKAAPINVDAIDVDTPRRTRSAVRNVATVSIPPLAKSIDVAPDKSNPMTPLSTRTGNIMSPLKEQKEKSPMDRNQSPAKGLSSARAAAPANSNLSPFKTPLAVNKTPVNVYSAIDKSLNKALSMLKKNMSPIKPVQRSPANTPPQKSPTLTSSLSPAKSFATPTKVMLSPMKQTSPMNHHQAKIASPMMQYSSKLLSHTPASSQPVKQIIEMFPVTSNSPYVNFPMTHASSPANQKPKTFPTQQSPVKGFNVQQSPVRMFPSQSPQRNQYALYNTSPHGITVQNAQPKTISPNRVQTFATPMNGPNQGVRIITPQKQTIQLGKDITVMRISPTPITNAQSQYVQHTPQYVQHTPQYVQHTPQYVQQSSQYAQAPNTVPNSSTFTMTPTRQSARLRNTPQIISNQLYTPKQLIPTTQKNTFGTPQKQSLLVNASPMKRQQVVGLQITPVQNGMAATSSAYNQTTSLLRSAQSRGRNVTTEVSNSAQLTITSTRRGLRNRDEAKSDSTSTIAPQSAKLPMAEQDEPILKSESIKSKTSRATKRKVDELIAQTIANDSDVESSVGRPKRNRRHDEVIDEATSVCDPSTKPKRGRPRKKTVEETSTDDDTKEDEEGATQVAEDKPKRGGRRGKQETTTTIDDDTKEIEEVAAPVVEDKPKRGGRRGKQTAADASSVPSEIDPIETYTSNGLNEPMPTEEPDEFAWTRPKRTQQRVVNYNETESSPMLPMKKMPVGDEVVILTSTEKMTWDKPMRKRNLEVKPIDGEEADAPLAITNGHNSPNLESAEEKPKRGGARKKVTIMADTEQSAKRGGRMKRLNSATDKSESDGEAFKQPKTKKLGGRTKRVDSSKSNTDQDDAVESSADNTCDEQDHIKKPSRGGRKPRVAVDLDDVIEIDSDASSCSESAIRTKRRGKVTAMDSSDEERSSLRVTSRSKYTTKLKALNEDIEEESYVDDMPVVASTRGSKRKNPDVDDMVNGAPSKQSKLNGDMPNDLASGSRSKRGKQLQVDVEEKQAAAVKMTRSKRGTKRSAQTSDDDEEPLATFAKQKKTDATDETEPTAATKRMTRRRAK